MKTEMIVLHSVFALLLSAGGCHIEPPNDEETAGTTAAAPPGTTAAATPETTADSTGEAPTAELPPELRAVWLDSWSTSMGYLLATEMYDFETGVWFKGYPEPWDMAPYRGYGISFDQHGNFIWVLGSDAGVGGCKSYSIDFMKGTAALVDADTLRFHAAARRQRYHSTCNPDLDFDRDASGGTFEMDFVLGATQDGGLPTLRLLNKDDGTPFDYFKN